MRNRDKILALLKHAVPGFGQFVECGCNGGYVSLTDPNKTVPVTYLHNDDDFYTIDTLIVGGTAYSV